MEYKYNGKRATSLGSEGIIITKENSYEATKVTGLKRPLIYMFKYDKEMQGLLKDLILDKNKLAKYNIKEFTYLEYNIKKLADNSYMLYHQDKLIKEFKSVGEVLEALYNLVMLEVKKTISKVEELISFIIKKNKLFIQAIEKNLIN